MQIYIVNFFSSGRVVINVKDFRTELLEIHIPKLEELYGISFGIKGATQLIQTTSENDPDHSNNNQQDNILNGQDTSNIRNGKDTQNKNHHQNNILEKKIKFQTITNTMNNKQIISYFRTTHAIRTMTTKQQQKTQATGYTKYQHIKRMPHPNIKILREKLLLNNLKRRRSLIIKLNK